jgi:hypothetical protein
LATAALVPSAVSRAAADSVTLPAALATLQAADRTTGDQTSLQQAWRRAAEATPEELGLVLRAMQGAGPLAENWLRAAVDAAAERVLGQQGDLPRSLLEGVLLDRSEAPRARRVAYEWLLRVDPPAAERLLPRMLDDPSLELRLDAVGRVIARAAAAADDAERRDLYRQAFDAALDIEQIKQTAAALKELGVEVDLARRLGFVTQWRLIGPFDNTGLKGFDAVYPPETDRGVAETQGKSGLVSWKTYRTADPFGVVDLNVEIGSDKEVVAYAVAEVSAAAPLRGHIRLASKNAPKAWFNGRPIGAFEVYHAGSEIDQYVMPVEIAAGRNEIVVKLSQNEKKMAWEKEWDFQLRVTDLLGAPAPVTQSGDSDQ